jgi:alginate O-acetyltransferase complex protein AlgI
VLFVELRFFVFFAAIFGLYWALRSHTWRKLWLVACSYIFYGAWDWRFLSLIVVSTLLDYVVGVQLGLRTSPGARKAWLMASVVGNLGLLGAFKYFNFFAESLVELGNLFGMSLSHTTLQIVLPAGISFYTFQTMSYSLDIYYGKLRSAHTLLDVSLFVAFFPQLVAGPIIRASDFLPQLESARRFPSDRAREYLMRFLVGFFKKACIADNLALFVDAFFRDPSAYGPGSVQIYCDFSGYSDMAVALAGLLGYDLMENFRAPYFAASITDFWRRWHISLSSWLKDYLYVPLGGNRGSKLFTYRNLLITMLLGGLWHGAAWNFVIWGGLHGLALIAHKEWRRVAAGRPALELAGRLAGLPLTFYWVCITWIFFRTGSLDQALTVLRGFVLLQTEGTSTLFAAAPAILMLLALAHWIAWTRALEGWWRRAPAPLFAVAYSACFALAVGLVPMDHLPFIYFQF